MNIQNKKLFPLNVNKYSVLRTLTEPQVDNPPISYKTWNTVKKYSEKISAKNSERQKIIIIGDSHARSCAADIDTC
jgi:hypothetical protein